MLTRLPFGRLKIDRSFVSNCLDGAEGMFLVNAMTDLARNLKLSVTAEGVETADQAAMLAARGVDLAQGYLFSRPVRGMEAVAMIDRDWWANGEAFDSGKVGRIGNGFARSA